KNTSTMKKKLNNIGFGGITVTTLYGSFTEKRVKDFQRYYGLKVNGIADDQTLAKLNEVYNSPLQLGKTHKDTTTLKRNLNRLGFKGITVTSYFGDYTEKKLKDFQKYYGLKANGIADAVTLKKVDDLVNSPFQQGKRHKDTPTFKKKLNRIGFGNISVTTLFGSFTDKKVRELQ